MRLKSWMTPYGFEPAFRRLELYFSGFQGYCRLRGRCTGQFFAGFFIGQSVVDTQAAVDFADCHVDAYGLSEPCGAYVFQVHFYDGPTEAPPTHFIVAVAYAVEEGAACDFEVFDVVAVPNDPHRIDIEKRDLDDVAVAAENVFFVHEEWCSVCQKS